MSIKLLQFIRDLEMIYADIGDVEVCVKETTGHVNTRIEAGWDGDHMIGRDGDGKVAVISSYIQFAPFKKYD